MSFHASATSIELDDDHILKVTLLDGDGDEHEVEVDLNNHIGNDNGKFLHILTVLRYLMLLRIILLGRRELQ